MEAPKLKKELNLNPFGGAAPAEIAGGRWAQVSRNGAFRVRFAIFLLILGGLSGCGTDDAGGDPGRHMGEGRIYDPKEGFSIVPPKGWVAVEFSPEASFMTWAAPPSAGAFRANFNVRTFANGRDRDPIEAIGEAVRTEIGKMLPEFHFSEDGIVQIDGCKAYFIHFTALQQGSSKKEFARQETLQFIVLTKNREKGFIVTFSTLPDDFDKLRKVLEESAGSIRAN